MHEIAAEKYVQLTTYTKDGRAKPAPVWIADLGEGRVGFTTGLDSWKVKRIRNTPRIQLVASNARGAVKDGAAPVTGQAEVVTGADFDPVMAAIDAKYGFQVKLIKLLAKLRRQAASNCGVVITLDG